MDTRWSTPQPFFDMLNAEFDFTIDVAALDGSAKCSRFYTPSNDGLMKDWSTERFWMNPPYGRGQNVYAWVQKAFISTRGSGIGVCLLPASVDTKWFHDFCVKAEEIRFVKDRLWFSLDGIAQRANHASLVVVFRAHNHQAPRLTVIPNCRVLRSEIGVAS